MSQSDQLRIPESARIDSKSFELLRVWVAHQDQHISLRVGVWEDPADWGRMLADLARHIANSFEKFANQDAPRALEKIRAGFDAEIEAPAEAIDGEII